LQTHSLRDRADRAGVVAGDHTQGDALLHEVAQRVGRVVANALLEEDQGDRFEIRQGFTLQQLVRAGQQQHAPAVGRELVGAGACLVGRSVGQDHLGRADDPSAVFTEGRRTPFAGRRERNRCRSNPSRRWSELGRQRAHGGVAVLVGCHRAERLLHRCLIDKGLDAVERDGALREGAGLVEQHDIDTGKALDRGELLYQHVPSRERDRRHREREARQQHETLGHHGDDTGDDPRDCLPPPVVRGELAEREEASGRDDGPLDVTQDEVDAVHQLRAHQREASCFGGKAPRVRVRPDAYGLHAPLPRHDDAAGEHVVVRLLGHRVGLTREHRLVDLEPLTRAQDTVRGNLVAGSQLDEVIERDLLDRDFFDLTVAHDASLWRRQDCKAVERSLRPVFLHDADQGIRHQDEPEQCVLRRADDQDQDEECSEQRVEPREDVGSDDFPEAATRALVSGVDLAPLHTLGDLGGRESLR
jgi:hypothetical protein